MRVVLLTLDSPLSDAAVAAFLAAPGVAEVVRVVRSNALRGGRSWARSGWRLLPYLLGNYGLPALLARLPGCGVAAAARARGIPCVAWRDDGNALREARPDLLVALHFDRILDAATLAIARHGGINLHPSLLPRHRGPLPLLHALAETPPATGVTVHRMIPRIDAGAVLAQRAVPLAAGCTASAAGRALHLAGVPLLRQAIAGIAAGAPEPAAPEPLPYCPYPTAAALRAFFRAGHRLIGPRDLRVALAGG